MSQRKHRSFRQVHVRCYVQCILFEAALGVVHDVAEAALESLYKAPVDIFQLGNRQVLNQQTEKIELWLEPIEVHCNGVST